MDLDDAAGRLYDRQTEQARREHQERRDRRALRRDRQANAIYRAVHNSGIDGITTVDAAYDAGVEHVDASSLLWRLADAGRVMRIEGQRRCWVSDQWSGQIVLIDPWWRRIGTAIGEKFSRHSDSV